MKTVLLTAALLASGLALSLFPLAVNAAPTHHAMKKPMKMAATMYECQKCHMKVSAATAKKDHYKDPMDGGKLTPVMNAPAKGASMPGMKM
jgi:hypothetical protein